MNYFSVLFVLFIAIFDFCCSNVLGNQSEKTSQVDVSRSTVKFEHIRDFPECADDIVQFCHSKFKQKNFDLLVCLKGSNNKPNTKLSQKCQARLWHYQLNLTKSQFFESHGSLLCKEEYKKFCDNPAIVKEMGGPLFCLLHYKKDTQYGTTCYDFLTEVSRVVFYDYAVLKPFLDSCTADIQKFKCERTSLATGSQSSTQSVVFECLEENLRDLSAQCKGQLLRLTELQADDYHLDTGLYFACRQSRDELCGNVMSGEGRVLQCLMHHKYDARMESECRHQLRRRQKLRSEDYKTDYRMQACEKDIHRYKCNQVAISTNSHETSIRLSAVLLCLATVDKDSEGEGLEPDCKAEMLEVRKELMEDYVLTPDLVISCRSEIQSSCASEVSKPGGALHCLLRLAQEVNKFTKRSDQQALLMSNECLKSLSQIVRVIDPSENIRVDPIVSEACAPVIQSGFCQDSIRAHGGNVYPCLYRLLVEPHAESNMDEVCAEKVLQLQYILMRNFQLSDSLYRACHKDAIKHCNAPVKWYDPQQGASKSSDRQIVFHCLYQLTRKKDDESSDTDEENKKPTGHISPICQQQVKLAVHLQAQRIELNPQLYDACIPDLSKHCIDRPVQEEYVCLQEHLEKLGDQCRNLVVQFSEAQDEDISLDLLMMRACSPMLKMFCSDSEDEKDPMACLIRMKQHRNMDSKCRASIEHHQILSLKDYHISTKFSTFCASEIHQYCSDKTSKTDVVSCLSENLLRDILLPDAKVSFKASCRKQLRFELFQRSTGFILDPRLQHACKEDVDKLCSRQATEKTGVIMCLQSHQDDLSPACHKAIFKRERLMAFDNRLDAPLRTICKSMIQRHCSHIVDPRRVLDCLREVLNDGVESFDGECERMVKRRLEVRHRDYRLDPMLQSVCKVDIEKRCRHIISSIGVDSDKETRGRVLQCLKDIYRSAKDLESQLARPCGDYIRQVMIEANLDYRLDPLLRVACKADAMDLCTNELEDSGTGLGVTECLKRGFLKGFIKDKECRTQIRRVLDESKADVHVDPLLYRACSSELRTVCGGVPLGNGKQLSCLLLVREQKDASTHLSEMCMQQLDLRIQMWSINGQVMAPKGVVDLAQQIQQSNAKFYILSVLCTIVLVIFIVGLCCGRVTKRVPVSLKNK